MPGLNYSKFDKLEDSDDEKDPKAEAEKRRQEMFEEMQLKMKGQGTEEPKKDDTKPQHQKDRFSYGEADCDNVAHELLRTCLCKTPSVKVGIGILSVAKVEKVEGDAMMLKVRGEPRFTFDISFRLQFVFQWMGTNFDEGSKRAEGAIVISDFTDATTLHSDKSPPAVKKWWLDKGGLSDDRVKEIGGALGGKGWPPAQGSLLAAVVAMMEVYVEELPRQTFKAAEKQKTDREEIAQEEEEEFQAGGGVRIEEVPVNKQDEDEDPNPVPPGAGGAAGQHREMGESLTKTREEATAP